MITGTRVAGIDILMYHQIGSFDTLTPTMRGHRSTYCRIERFRSQMAWLKRWNYAVLGMDDVAACLGGMRPVPPRAVALTFDDGYAGFHDHVWPVLRQCGFPAMVYLVSGLVGKPSGWFAADGRDTPALLSATQIRTLRAEGCDFGGHSVNHVKLAELPRARMRTEIHDCKHMLEDMLGEEIHHFCYPFGSHDRHTIDEVQKAGYTSATTCVRARVTTGVDPLAIPRKAVSWGDNLIGMLWKLHVKNRPKQTLLHRTEQ
jgi:peptidoglycan/xylan/chitin deacetylase (PgdA/CDA1 family)